MNRMRTWSLGAAGLALLIVVAGWFLLISPAKSKVSDLNTQTAAQQQTNAGLATQVAQLKLQNKALPKQEAKLAEIRRHLPPTPAMPAFITTLTQIATDSGVKLVSVAPATPSAVTTVAPVVATPTPSASASSGSATDDTPVTPAAPVAPPSALRMVPVAITVNGTYYNVVAFLSKVENLKRSMLVYAIQITPGVAGGASASPSSSSTATKLTVSLNTRIFYSPPDLTKTTPAAGATPAASGAAAPATAS